MADHGRKKSRGSLSIFSLDAIRSMSRAGSRPACRLSNDEDQRAKADEGHAGTIDVPVLADPLLRPLPPTPATSTHQRSNLSHITLTTHDQIVPPRQRVLSDEQEQAPVKSTERDLPKPRKHRPLSWFSPSSSISGQRWPLPKDSSASTIGASIISAPVLTSTTNAKVALTEGVHCGKMTASGFTSSSWQSKSGWVTDIDAEDVPNHQVEKLPREPSPNDQKSRQYQLSPGVSESHKGHSRRSASVHALSKVKDMLTTRLRQASDSQTYRSVFKRDKFVRLGDECRPPSPLNERLAHVETEGRRLGRGKIRVLTGQGNVRRKPVRRVGRGIADDLVQEHQKFATEVNDTLYAKRPLTDQGESPLDFKFEDLETSFTKAVENLDFRLKRDKASFASLSSLFHSARSFPVVNLTKTPPSLRRLPAGPCLHLSSNAEHHTREPPLQSGPDQIRSGTGIMGQCASRIPKISSGRAKAGPGVYDFSHQAHAASDDEGDQADRSARAQRIFARGHSNPLASHPDLTRFVVEPASPNHVTDLPRGTTKKQGNDEELDLSGLKDAPIYSPSLENLSQYDRNTPSSAPRSTNMSSCQLHTMTSQMPLMATPTRPSRRGVSGIHDDLKQNWNIAGTSSNEAPRKGDRLDKTRTSCLRTTQSRELVDGKEVHSERVLTSKDQNARMVLDRFGNDRGGSGTIATDGRSNFI